VNSCILGR